MMRTLLATAKLLSVLILVLVATAPQPLAASPQPDPVPVVSLDVPAEVFIGEDFSFNVTFNNTDPADTGYGPFIDVVLPVNGADGAGNTSLPLDGIDFQDATFLGQPVQYTELTFPDTGQGVCGAGQTQLDHPYAVDNTYTPLPVCGTPGDKLVSILLPFGSFAPDQPPATVTIDASLSDHADLGVPLPIRARGGFEFGMDPLDNWCCDAAILTDSDSNSDNWSPTATVTPTLLTLSKGNDGPEGETATGPNYLRTYTVNIDVADGQTVTGVNVTDYIDDNIVVTGVTNITSGGALVSPAAFPYGPVTNGEIVVNFPSISGSASFDVQFYVPELDASGAPVIDPLTGDDTITENRIEAAGNWTPLDPRDGATPVEVNGPCPVCPPADTLDDKSIATQKSVASISGPVQSGATLEYTLEFQISDYFTFDNIVITDAFSDGQRFDTTFTPTISVTDRAGTTSGSLSVLTSTTDTCATAGTDNVIVDESQIGNDADPATDGSTTVTFCVSEALVDLGAADGVLQGGRAIAPDAGSATGTITFRTQVQDNFSDTYPSGDPSVDHGDELWNDVTIIGDVLDNATLAPTGSVEDDDSGTLVTIAQGDLTKTLYAINGAVPSGSPPLISPGDVVTYRLQYTMPSSDFEDFSLTDYLPMPIFDATEITAFDDVFSTGPADAPAAGRANWGNEDTFRTRCEVVGGTTCLQDVDGGAGDTIPDVTIDPVSNSVEFFFGDFDDPGNNDTVIDILFSVTVSDDPFADGLYLTNQVRSQEGSTNAGDQTADDIVQVQLGEPVLEIRKGVIGTDNADSAYAPDPPIPAGFPNIGSDDLGNSVDSDLDDADARDTIEFAIVLENVGSSTGGAFDVEIRDQLPPGLAIPSGGINLQIQRGNGDALASNLLGAAGPEPSGLFGDGIEIFDPSAPTGPVCQKYHPDDGSNLIIVTYELVIDPSVEPGDVITNGALLENFAGTSGGPNHLDDGSGGVQPKEDDATVNIVGWDAPVKSIVATSETHTAGDDVAVGEIVRYRLAVQVPEATAPNFAIVDTLSTGVSILDLDQVRLSFVADNDMTASNFSAAENTAANNDELPPTSFTLPAGNITQSGNDVTFSLGDLVNNDNDDSTDGTNPDEYVYIEFNALVENVAANDLGDVKANVFDVQSNGTPQTTSNTVNATVVEPVLTVSKTPDGASGDAGDTITFTVTVSNPGGTDVESAFDVVWTDVVPAGMTYVGGTLTHDSGVAPDSGPDDSDPIGTGLTASWSELAPGDSSTLTFDVTLDYTLEPAETVTNTADVTWTSLPGTGTTGNPTGSDTPGDSGDADGERNGTSGGVNDHIASDDGDVTIDSPAPVKEIVTTSESHTSDDAALDGTPGNERPLAVGEVLQYRLTSTIPEGTSTAFQIVDTFTPGIALIEDAQVTVQFTSNSDITSTVAGLDAANGAPLALFDGAAPSDGSLVSVAGQDVTFSLGTLTNNDSDGDAEYVVIEFNVVVLNNADVNLGDVKDNFFEVVIDGTTRGTSNTVSAEIVEPVLTVSKTPDGASGDAGDTITFTVEIENTGTSTAFDVVWTDVVPNGMTYTGGTLAHTGVDVAPDTLNDGDPTGTGLTATWSALAPGDSSTLTFDVTLDYTLEPAETVTNTADVTWTSLPGTGTTGNPTGSDTPGGSGDADGERNGTSGGVNDHIASDDGDVTIDSPAPVKEIVTTSESHTSDDASLDGSPGNERPLAVGEVLRYRLTSTIPEGTSTAFQIVDTFTPGIALIEDAQVTVEFQSDGGITSSVTALNGANSGPLALYEGAAPLDGSQVAVAGQQITFDLGTLQNNDSDGDAEYVVIEFNVVVLNNADVNLGDVKDNFFEVVIDGNSRATSNTVSAEIVEPQLTVSKTASPDTGDGLDTITFTLTVSHDGTSTADAFEVNLTDTIPAGMTYVANSLQDVSGVSATLDDSSAPTLSATWTSLATDESSTISFQATLDPSVQVGETYTNTAAIDWSSLPGTGTTGNPTDSDTPGGSGDANGERNGTSGGVNTYNDDGDDTVTIVGSYSATKSITATSESHTSTATPEPVAIGEIIRYQLAVTLPEGTSENVQLIDQLSAGIVILEDTQVTVEFVSDDAMDATDNPVLNAANSGPLALYDNSGVPLDGSLVDVTGSPQLVTFNLGDIVNNDNDGDAETVIVRFNVLVVNDAASDLGDILANDFDLAEGGVVVASSNTVEAVIVEPQLTITKSANPATGDAGDPITFEITVTNGSGVNVAEAFDVQLSDVVPADMNYVANSLQDESGVSATTLDDSGAPTLSAGWDRLAPGQSSTISFQATLDVALNIGDSVTNTAAVTWTSLPGTGTTGNPTGSDTPGGSGDANGERDGSDGAGTAPNDHAGSDDAIVSVTDVTLLKGIASTSEAHTATATPEPLAVGEIVRYRLAVQVPEATSVDFTVTDNLPAGLQYLDDGTTQIAFVSDTAGSITSSTISGAGLFQTGDETTIDTITPTFDLPGGALSGGPFTDGTDPVFSFGTLVNNDGDPDSEFVLVEFNALVLNNANNNNGDAKDNTFTVTIDSTDRGTSPPIEAEIVEPVLTVQKDATPPVAVRGDTITFTITVEHSAASTADAQDVLITDIIPSGMTWAGNVTAVSGLAPGVDASDPAAVEFSWSDVPLGATYSFTYDATVDTGVALGTVLTNVASMEWSSLPGTGTTGNPTGSDTPGDSGEANGERDGSGTGENDYTAGDTADVTVPNIGVTKTDALQVDNDSDGTVDPGDTIRYTVTLVNNTGGPVDNAVFSDTPGANTALVVGSVTTTQGTVASGLTPGDTTVQVDLGTFADGASVTITFDVVVDFPLANVITQVANHGALDGDGIPTIPSDDSDTPAEDDETVTPVEGEPIIEATKVDALYDDANGDSIANSGDTLEYTVVITNTGGRDAEDVVFSDTPDANTTLEVGSVTTSQGTVTFGNGTGDASVQVDVGTVDADGGTVTITFRVLINDPLNPPTTIEVANQGTVSGSNFLDEPTDDSGTPTDDDETITPLITAPIIEAEKVDALFDDVNGNSLPDPGDTLEYTVTITNVGGVDAANVIFTDTPDANTALEVGSVTTDLGTITGGNTAGDTSVAVDIGTLAADGGTVTVTFRVLIDDPLPAGTTQIANQGLVTGDNFTDRNTDDPDTPDDNDETVTPLETPTVEADKVDALFDDVDGDGVADPGDTLEYTVTLTNTGSVDATGVIFNDTPDANTTLVDGSVTTSQGAVTLGNTSGDTAVEVDVGTLAATSGTATITFQVTIDDPLPAGTTQVANQGTVSGDNFDDEPTDDTDTPTDDDETVTPLVDAPLIEADKVDALVDDVDGDGAADPGDTLEYTVTLTNVGSVDATDVIFLDTPGINTTLVDGSVTTSLGLVTLGNTSGDTAVEVDVGTLAATSGTATITFQVTIDDPLPAGTMQVANQGTVSGDNFDDEPTDDTDTPTDDDETVTPIDSEGPTPDEPDLTVIKTDALFDDSPSGDGVPSENDVLQYTVTLTNTGTGTLQDVVFDDTPDANTTLVTGTVNATQGTVVTGNTSGDTAVQVDIGDIPAGVSVEVIFNVSINTPLPPDVTIVANQALVTGANVPDTPSDDPDTPPEDDPTVTPIGDVPLVEAYKTDELTGDANGNDEVNAGDVVTYTVTLYNFGYTDAQNVVFTDTPDANTTLVIGSATVSDASALITEDSSLTVDIPLLAPGDVVEITFEVRVDDPLPVGLEQIANQGTVSGDNFDDEPTDDSDEPAEDEPTITPLNNPLPEPEPVAPAITVFDPAISKVGILEEGGLGLTGEQLTWQLTITNVGDGPGTDVVITDTIADDLGVDGAAIENGSYSITGQTVTFFIPYLSPDETIMAYIYTTVLDSPLDVENTATLSGFGPDGAAVTRSDTAFIRGVDTLPSTGYEDAHAPAASGSPARWIIIAGAGLGLTGLVTVLGMVARRRRR